MVLLEVAAGAALPEGDFAGFAGRAVSKVPVAILLWVAICAVALAAAQRDRAFAVRRRANMLHSALVHARQAVSAPQSERLLVTTGRRRTPVML